MADHLSKDGASALADRIKAYWRERGYRGIKTVVSHVARHGYGIPKDTYQIRSNIGPTGYPPDCPSRDVKSAHADQMRRHPVVSMLAQP